MAAYLHHKALFITEEDTYEIKYVNGTVVKANFNSGYFDIKYPDGTHVTVTPEEQVINCKDGQGPYVYVGQDMIDVVASEDRMVTIPIKS